MSTVTDEAWRKYIAVNKDYFTFVKENDDEVELISEEEFRSMLGEALAEENEEDKLKRLKKIAQSPNASLSILQEIIDYAHTMKFSWVIIFMNIFVTVGRTRAIRLLIKFPARQ